jgi:hypothetical protein
MAKSWLTVVCRRRTKELNISKVRSEAGRRGAEVVHGKKTATQKAIDGQNTGTGIGIGNGRERVQGEGPPVISEQPPSQPASDGVPTLDQCKAFALDPTCGFPAALVEEWYHKQCDRGWGNDWRARMRGAVHTWRAIAFERKIDRRKTGFDPSKNTMTPRTVVNETPVSHAARTTKPVTEKSQNSDLNDARNKALDDIARISKMKTVSPKGPTP